MKKSRNYQRGFALGGSILAWALGLASLFGGAQYFANKKIDTQTPVQNVNRTRIMNIRANNNHNFIPDYQQLQLTGEQSLTAEEREGIITMREEEKLARDVYRTLYEKWGLNIFQNISYSENRHTLAMKALLDVYGIDDPVKDDTTGKFTIPEMQKLYDDLVKQGSASLVDALKVGATIEDLDIADLKKWMAKTDNPDILKVYDNLIRGSRNHMRSFIGQLKDQGASYDAQYLSQDEIESIVNSEMERGALAGTYQGLGRGKGQGLRNGSGQGRGRGFQNGNKQKRMQGQGFSRGQGRGQGRGMGWMW